MKLELLDAEVTRYMSMGQQLVDLTRYVDDLKTALSVAHEYIADLEGRKLYQEKPTEPETPPPPSEPEEKALIEWTVSDWIAFIKEGGALENRKGTTWTEDEDHILLMAVGMDHSAFNITSLASGLGRTVDAVVSRAVLEYGFMTRKGKILHKKAVK